MANSPQSPATSGDGAFLTIHSYYPLSIYLRSGVSTLSNDEKCRLVKLMGGYIKILETKPTHYIYNLKLPVEKAPIEVVKLFKKSGLNLFYIENSFYRHTSGRYKC